MNYNQMLILFLQGTLIASVILLLFRFRKKLGYGVLYACLGLFQFVQVMVFILNTTYSSITNKFLIFPGSSIFMTITLFTLLIVYIKEDAKEIKKIIYTIFIVNGLILLILLTFFWNINDTATDDSLNISYNFLKQSPTFIFGNFTLFLDSLILISIFELLSKKIKFLFLQIFITMVIVVSFDTIFFSTIIFWNLENLVSIIVSGLISKNTFAIYFSLLFYGYLRYLEETDKDLVFLKITDVFKSLTYKQKFEVALDNVKKSEEMYRLLTNNSNDIICLLELNGTYSFISPSIKTVLGYNQSDFLGKNIFSIVHKDDIDSLKKKIDKKIFNKDNTANIFTFRLLHLKGYYVWVEYTISPIYKGKKINSFVSSARDVTQRVLVNNQFKTSLQLLEKKEYALNQSSTIGKIGFFEYNTLTNTYIWSDYLYFIFGLNPKEKIPPSKKFLAFFEQESQEKIKTGIKNLNLKGISFKAELRANNTKNERIWLKAIINPVYNEQKEIIGRRGILQNITNYKKTLIELENSKQETQNSLNLLEKNDYSLKESSRVAKIGYWEYDIKSENFKWSDYVYKIYGLNPKEKIPSRKEMLAFYDQNSLISYKKAIKNLSSNHIPYDVELKILNLKKEEIWVRIVIQLVYDKQNKITGRRGIIQNITEFKKTQLELENSKQEIQNSLNLLEKKNISLKESSRIAKIGYSEYHFKTDSYIWSDYVYKIFGLDPKKEIPSRDKMLAFYDKNSLDKLNKATEELPTKGIYDLELKLINLKKEKVWIRIVAHLIYNKQNKIVGRSAVMYNITATKNIQFELEKTNKKNKQSLELLKISENSRNEVSKIAKIGYQDYNSITNTSNWSDYIYKVLGFDPKEGIPHSSKVIQVFYNESKIKIAKAINDLENKGISYDIEVKLFNKIKGDVWVRYLAQPVFNNENKIVGKRGIMQNITEQKRIIAEIEKAKEMYRLVTDHSNDIICLHDSKSNLKYISPSVTNLLGYEQSEYIGKQFFSAIHNDDIVYLKNDIIDRKTKHIFTDSFIFRARHKDGHFIWLEALSSFAYNENKTNYFVSTARDITQSVIAKQKIQEYQTSLQKLTTEITLVEENQKKEIATNIHDHLSQSLVISKMKIKELQKNPQLKIISDELNFVEDHISEALANSRKITSELSPPILYQLGIIEALYWLLDNIESKHKIKCNLYDNINKIELNDVHSILLYRSIQEILNNAIKYAKASLINIDLNKTNLGLEVIIIDNGVGFNTSILNNFPNQNGSGFGLFTVKERIKNINGEFRITSKVNKGTTVLIQIPL